MCKASQGDVGHAVGLLTAQTAEVQDPGDHQDPGAPGESWDDQKGEILKHIFSRLISKQNKYTI